MGFSKYLLVVEEYSIQIFGWEYISCMVCRSVRDRDYLSASCVFFLSLLWNRKKRGDLFGCASLLFLLFGALGLELIVNEALLRYEADDQYDIVGLDNVCALDSSFC